jgi:Flp pilus assembly pilin Flp
VRFQTTAFRALVRHIFADEGATAAEYAVMAAAIAAVVAGIIYTLGLRVFALFSSIPAF